MQVEKWKEINGLPGYKISSMGNVLGKDGTPYKSHAYKSTKGYFQVRFPMHGKTKKLHRLVAEHFIECDDRSLQVNHKDGNKANNAVDNLEYVTCKQNIEHAIKLGLRTARINLKNNAMFSYVQILAIKDAIMAGHGNTPISHYFKCDHSTISKIRTGKNYPSFIR